MGPLVQPYARLDSEGKLQYLTAGAEYSEFPLMRRLSLMHFIETKYNDFEEVLSQSQSVSKLLIVEMARLAQRF